MRRIFILAFFVLTFSILTKAQGVVTYGFLEVVDYKNAPVEDASIKIRASCEGGDTKTNKKGRLDKGFPIGFGDCQTYDFNISKDGYYPFDDFFGIAKIISREAPTKIELLKIPRNEAEQKAIGDEQLKREFFVAARRGDPDAVRRFLKSGLSAKLTTSELRGVPARKDVPVFSYAVSSGKYEVISEFISAGIEVRNFPKILIDYLNADPYNYDYGAAEATIKGRKAYEEGFIDLVKKGADISAKSKNEVLGVNGSTPLMIAAYSGYPKAVELLIAKGIAVEAKEDLNRTALIYALMSSHHLSKISVLESLLQAGANPNFISRNNYGDCNLPLVVAVASGDAGAVKTLLKYKANVNSVCSNGKAPINEAVAAASPESVRILLEAKANITGEPGHRALISAKENLSYCSGQTDHCKKIEEIIKLLEAAGAK